METRFAGLSREEMASLIVQLEAAIEQSQERVAALEATVTVQASTIEQLREQVAALEARIDEPPSGTSLPAFVKPKRQQASSKPRKRRAQAFVRRRQEPTRWVEHALEECQDCGTHLVGGAVKRRRQVLHVPLVAVEVVEHRYLERRCPVCGKRNVPRVELAGEVVGKNRLSTTTMALIASLREVGRLPLATIQWYLHTFHRLKLSVGEIVRVLAVVSEKAKARVEEVLAELRGSALVHADETGWREEGVSGYLWSFSNEHLHYLTVRQSRASKVVEEVLGTEFAGVLVSDFYAAYNCLDGPHQRCWVHFLRDLHQLEERHPEDEALQEWCRAVQELYREAKVWAEKNAQAPKRERMAARQDFEEGILQLAQPYLGTKVPQATLCQRIDRFLGELFTFVELTWVPADNNAAERALRHHVVSRKISGGTRSPKGSHVKATLASLFSTWRLQGQNPFLACRELLNSP